MAVNTTRQPNTPDIQEARNLLSPYLDGEVSAAERALVDQTLAASPELRAELASLRQTIALVAALPHVAAPRPFTLSAAEVGAAAPKKLFRLPAWAGGLAALAAVLVCVLAVGGVFFRGQFGAQAPQPAAYAPMPTKAAEKPTEQVVETAAVKKEEAKEVVTKEVEKQEEALATAVPPPPAAPTEEIMPAAEALAAKSAADTAVGAAPTERQAKPGEGALALPASTPPLPVSETPTPLPVEEKPAAAVAEVTQEAAISLTNHTATPASTVLPTSLSTATPMLSPTATSLPTATTMPVSTPAAVAAGGEPSTGMLWLIGLMVVVVAGLITWAVLRRR